MSKSTSLASRKAFSQSRVSITNAKLCPFFSTLHSSAEIVLPLISIEPFPPTSRTCWRCCGSSRIRVIVSVEFRLLHLLPGVGSATAQRVLDRMAEAADPDRGAHRHTDASACRRQLEGLRRDLGQSPTFGMAC